MAFGYISPEGIAQIANIVGVYDGDRNYGR